MNREGHKNVEFFYGTEVEHTPAFGMPTLFVVGIQPEEWIAYRMNGRRHIYFGANQSFPQPRHKRCSSLETVGRYDPRIS